MSDKRVAIISIIAENRQSSAEINALLSDFGEYIVGRMGIPYRERGIFIMSIVIDSQSEIINRLTGKLGMLTGVTAKTLMAKDKKKKRIVYIVNIRIIRLRHLLMIKQEEGGCGLRFRLQRVIRGMLLPLLIRDLI